MTSQFRKRLAVWQTTHKQLLSNDAQYRRRFHRYLVTLMCLCCLLLPFYLSFFSFRLFGFPANQCIIVSIATVIVILALRQFRFQKERIRIYLENQSPKI